MHVTIRGFLRPVHPPVRLAGKNPIPSGSPGSQRDCRGSLNPDYHPFGRIYCSVICPMGIFQDIVSHSFKGWRKRHKKTFSWSPEKKILRYGVLAVFIILLVAGFTAIADLVAPYSSFGRIAQNLFAPIWAWGNNLCAWIAEKADGYGFAHKEVWIRSIPTFIIAAVTFIIIFILAARNGRTYCNTICPVGTILSFFSRFAIFRPMIDTGKCKSCHACERNCKAACIDIDHKKSTTAGAWTASTASAAASSAA